MKKNEIEKNVIYFCIWIAMFLYLFAYIIKSVGEVPLMDYWKDDGSYYEQIVTQPINLQQILSIPHELHHNPFFGISNYYFVKVFKCNNYIYVFSGMFFVMLSAAVVLMLYKKQYEKKRYLLDFIGGFLFVFPLFNLNQWEIFTLYCSCAFMFRIFVYIVMFIIYDRLLKGLRNNQSCVSVILYGAFSVIIIYGISQAYFPGFVVAICFVTIVDIIKNGNDRRCWYSIGFQIGGVVLYVVTLTPSFAGGEQQYSVQIIDYFKGMLLMLASVIVHQNFHNDYLNVCYVIGFVILVFALIAVYLYFKKEKEKISYFPICCMVYAFVSIVVIMMGRISAFGVISLGSSRYVVETTVGIMGMVQIYWSLLDDKKIVSMLSSGLLIAIVMLPMCYSNRIERGVGVYRKIYNDNMKELLINIDNVEDEDLAIFQAPAQQVRACASVMKKYKLSVWSK